MSLTLELPPEKEAVLRAQAQARGLTVQEWLLRLAEQFGPCLVSDEGRNEDARPIWEIIAEAGRDVPREDLAALPKDGASQVDHYIYGLPKRDS